MVKRLLLLTVTLLFLQITVVFSQITIGTVDAGPYTPGSSITAAFKIDPASCISRNNVFELHLVRPDGTEVPTPIGSYTGFYSTFVNGTIPLGTPAGTGYKLRISSSAPIQTTALSAPFEIKDGVAVTAALNSFAQDKLSLNPLTFGNCNTDPNIPSTDFRFTNSSSTGKVTVTIINELTSGNTTTLTFNTIGEAKTFAASLAHYTMIVRAEMADGTIGTFSYFLINNLAATAFTTTSGNTVCYPTGAFEYTVGVSENAGIGGNFPGNTYKIDWGDGTSNEYTLCDIVKNGNKVRHIYTQSSCGLSYTSGNQTYYNAFGVNVNVQSPFCGSIGAPLSTPARVVTRPENRFDFPQIACVGDQVTFVNRSIAGQRPNSTSINCTDNNMLYDWYVDGVLVGEDLTINQNFVHTFLTKKKYMIKLTSTGSGACPAEDKEFEICIQDPPKPAFTLPSNLVCLTSGTLTPANTSILDNTCPSTPVYRWNVSPSTGVAYIGGTSSSSITPQFRFSQIGIYNITLTIQTGTCEVTTIAQKVVVNTEPQATLSPRADLCQNGNFVFDPNATTTKTTINGNTEDLADTYTWEVTGGPFSYVAPSTANSKYPTINFSAYATYTVKLTYQNNCNTITRTQMISFSESPVPSITAVPNPICYNADINLQGAIANRTPQTTFEWIGAPGGIFSDPLSLTPTYTPTTAERNAGTAHIRLVVHTGLLGACAQVEKYIDVTITPNNTSTNPITTRTAKICTGDLAVFTPTSEVTGSSFTWSATNPDGNASGFTLNGTGNISEALTNNHPTQDAVVIYTITPKTSVCIGVPFTYTVIITPKTTFTATPASTTICSSKPVGIVLASILPNITYKWTSVATNGPTNTVMGNSNPSTPLATIDDALTNNGITQGSVVYTITPYSENNCPGTPIVVTILVDPALTTPNAGPNENICNLTGYTLQGNPAVVGTGTWTIMPTPGQTDPIIANEHSEHATVTGLTPGQSHTFRWAINSPGACSSKFSDVTITVNTPTVRGTTGTTDPTLVCEGTNSGTISLTGNVGRVLRWESSTDGGTTWNSILNTTTSYAYLNLTVPTQFRAVVQNGECTAENSTATAITIAPKTTIADGADQILCNETSVLLKGNLVAPGETGVWTMVSGNANAVITPGANSEATVTKLAPGVTYIFRWTITGNSPCGPTFKDVTIRNNAPIDLNSITTNATVCNGQTVIIDGSIPRGGEEGQYRYVWESQLNGGGWNVIPGETGEDLTITLATTGIVSFRRTVNSGTCTSISNPFPVTVQPPITGNTISADQVICSGILPALINGSPPAGGDNDFIYQWQSSPDGTTWTNIIGAMAQNYQPPILTGTIYYRRIVSTLACSGNLQSISTAVKVTVTLNAKAEFTWGTDDSGCIPYTLPIQVVAYPNRNATYTWYANNVILPSIGSAFPGYTIQNSGQAVTIKLVVTSSLGCSTDEFEHEFSTNQAVPASFTQSNTEGCGPLPVNFTNTSPLNAGATFRWDFGNGQTSTANNPTGIIFNAEPTGKDTTYVVTLTSITSCGPNSVTSTVLVKAKPIAKFSPSKTEGCSPMLVNFSNTSPGGSNKYYYDFGDGSAIIERTNKLPVTHTYNTTITKNFTVTMTAENGCGTDVKTYVIRVYPQNMTPELVVNGNQNTGCAPFTVNFDNNSIGASRFTFDFGDGGTRNTITTGTEQYTFTKPGTYTVRMTAYNSCLELFEEETITVLEQPISRFTSDVRLGCADLSVKFENLTQGGISYVWDFGDGSPTSNELHPLHVYKGDQEYYTVTLTATNTLGCSATISRVDYIRVVSPPIAAFNVNPSTLISIPNYTFKFEDESTNGPTIWEWNFGDGMTSALKNPNHTYLDTGTYKVTLKVTNQQGCFTTTFKNVTIKGVPGYLFVPNSFIPGNPQPELREFRAKGSGIQSWKFSVFNKWGQILWETTKLEEGRPAEGWDGTFKGEPMPQGVYYWKIDVQMVNGSEWKGMTYDSSPEKRTGPIHLIR
jgi:PKD repeat protein